MFDGAAVMDGHQHKAADHRVKQHVPQQIKVVNLRWQHDKPDHQRDHNRQRHQQPQRRCPCAVPIVEHELLPD
ncbi:hypothetical protein HC928_26245 [bacterium]|nr:hypothetical protein [bacterium]